MESFSTSKDLVQFIGKLGDLKDEHYQLILAQHAMIELLIDKGLFSRQELEHKITEVERLMTGSPYPMA
ncbi:MULTISPECIES: hypothetical protein [unclassified Paenibacillus]|uniref:hypothetical protein n=1 Tax=unclassified Paenibacillus TaxID=185978 RepID=UPI0003E23AE3|nr:MULTISPECIES: hypothetical protein [unclassified Paenibacillus]ETT39595.1 hypothetical protein C162_27517 [Paenibacillus sp. FSL R7-269]OMF87656.1 hypothetical protein BK147_28170 [Paenibacillus sp. FSL R7-0337]